jgi:hypothetical protein
MTSVECRGDYVVQKTTNIARTRRVQSFKAKHALSLPYQDAIEHTGAAGTETNSSCGSEKLL